MKTIAEVAKVFEEAFNDKVVVNLQSGENIIGGTVTVNGYWYEEGKGIFVEENHTHCVISENGIVEIYEIEDVIYIDYENGDQISIIAA